MVNAIRVVSATVIALFLTGCQSVSERGAEPLHEYIRSLGYEPFDIPNTVNGPGTLIRFANGTELPIAEAKECVPTASLTTGKLEVPNLQYSFDGALSLGVKLADAGSSSKVDVGGAFKDARVGKVSVKVRKANQHRISELALENALNSSDESAELCRKKYATPANKVILDVLIFSELEYSFHSKDDSALGIDAALGELIGWKVDSNNKLAIDMSLTINNEALMVGYKLWDVSLHNASLTGVPGRIDLVELSKDKVAEQKHPVQTSK